MFIEQGRPVLSAKGRCGCRFSFQSSWIHTWLHLFNQLSLDFSRLTWLLLDWNKNLHIQWPFLDKTGHLWLLSGTTEKRLLYHHKITSFIYTVKICCVLKITKRTAINVYNCWQKSANVQIVPKVSIFCVATIIFQHCLNSPGHGVH